VSSQIAVRLTDEQRQFLIALVESGRFSINMLTRAQILLAADTSHVGGDRSDQDIADAVRASPSTVYRVRKRFSMRGLPWALLTNGRIPRWPLLASADA
jgi:hypothetical protein